MDQRPGSLITDTKRALRAALIATRETVPVPTRAAFSNTIFQTIVALPEYQAASRVLAYMSMGAEFDTGGFVQHVLADGKVLVLPRVNRAARALDLYAVRDLETGLAPGVWGIREPRPDCCEPASPETIDFVLVPGLGFDGTGGRLGYGGGFYDRLLVHVPETTPRVAAAFSMQLVDAVPMGERDRYVNLVVTEQGALRAQR